MLKGFIFFKLIIMINELIKEVCEILEKCKISYMISGSIASNFYSIPRMTRDIDIVIELEQRNINNFISNLEGFYFDKEMIIDEVNRNGMFNIIHLKTYFKIDFILRKKSEYFENAFSRRIKLNEFGKEIMIISIEDLIISKFIWIQDIHSDLQLRDIISLLMNPNKDIEYIKHWCNKLNINTFNLLK